MNEHDIQREIDRMVKNRMNEQMENLMYFAGLTAQGCWDEMDEYNRKAIEKFAELIIKECANVADDWVNNTDNGVNYPSEVLKKHFGIE